MTQILHTETHGHGPPLVLLHGWGWNISIWETIVPQLAEDNEVYLIDLPGHGKSPPFLKKYNYENILPLIFSAIPERATWLGWSLGGLFATYAAIYFPHKVSRLITVASSPCYLQKDHWPGISSATLEKFAQMLMKDFFKTMNDFLELQLRGSKQAQVLLNRLQNDFSQSQQPDMNALLGGLELLQNSDLRLALKNISCPSLHIFGGLDRIVPAEIAKHAFFAGKNCQVIPHCGHIPFLTNQEEFLNLLKNQTNFSSNGAK